MRRENLTHFVASASNALDRLIGINGPHRRFGGRYG